MSSADWVGYRQGPCRCRRGSSAPETEIHRVLNVCEQPAVTIHCYSPPLERMGAYLVERDGYVRRRPISWDERLEARSDVASARTAAASSAVRRSGR